MMVLAPFAYHALTTMVLQMNCEDCDGIETARVTKIGALHSHTRWLHVEFGECSEIVIMTTLQV